MRAVNKGKLFVHMMAFVLARAVFFGARPLAAGMFAGAAAGGIALPGMGAVLLLGMAGAAEWDEMMKYLSVMAVIGIWYVLYRKVCGRRPGIAASALLCGLASAGVAAGGVWFGAGSAGVMSGMALSGRWEGELAGILAEGVLSGCLAVICSYGIRFFAEEGPGRNKSAQQVVAASLLGTAAVCSLPGPGELFFYAELAAFLCLMLMGYRQTSGEAHSYGRESYQDITRQRLTEMADSFERVSQAFLKLAVPKKGYPPEEIERIVGDMSERLCGQCEKCSRCWEMDYDVTCAAAEQIVWAAVEKGSVEKADVPVAFRKSCICMEDFLRETNRSLAVEKMKLAWYNQMAESREAVAGQLKEVARIVSEFSGELYETMEASGIREDVIIQGMKEGNIQVKKVSAFETGGRGMEVRLYARCRKGKCVTAREAAARLSRLLNRRFVPDGTARNVIGRDYSGLRFREEANYRVLTGVARLSKQGEEACGDNFSFLYPDTGEVIMMLADGMGSGEEAQEQSRAVIELLEDLLEAGFREEPAIRLINSLLVLRAGSKGYSTVDLGVINLYAGTCEFVKAGAVAAFIKRGDQVEVIEDGNLPAGIVARFDYEAMCRKLYEGDYVIMVTDGVTDCGRGQEKEGWLAELIAKIKNGSPQEIANTILKEALMKHENIPEDDMTVLVSGIWKR